jgi:hypothetical protein
MLTKPRWLQSFEVFKQSVSPPDTSTGMLYGVQEELNPMENMGNTPPQNPYFNEEVSLITPTLPPEGAPPELPPPTDPVGYFPVAAPPNPYLLDPIDYGQGEQDPIFSEKMTSGGH